MVENVTKLPVKKEKSPAASSALQMWRPFENLRQDVDRLFDDVGRGLWQSFGRLPIAAEPLFRSDLALASMPAVDIVEGEKAYNLIAELPGMDEKAIEVKVANGTLTIKGEGQEEKEEKKQDYYLHERNFGSFERSFGIPESVDADKIAATFSKGLLTVTLPKKPEAQKPARKVEVKAA